MKFCTLRVKNHGVWPLFEVTVESVISNDQNRKVEAVTVDTLKSFQVNEVTEFVVKYGVRDTEIKEALRVMQEQGHNVANFGYYGSFMYSAYEGVSV